MAGLDFRKLSDAIRYTMQSTFKATPDTLGGNREEAAAKIKEFLACYEDTNLIIYDFYDVSIIHTGADFMFWIHIEKAEDLQVFYNAFLHEIPLD